MRDHAHGRPIIGRFFRIVWGGWLVAAGGLPAAVGGDPKPAASRPNILFCIADDWGWPDAGAYGDPVVRTPAFDRVAREGVLFENAFVTSPSCTPSRNSILTGQLHWRLGAGANLWSSLGPEHPVYPLVLADAIEVLDELGEAAKTIVVISHRLDQGLGLRRLRRQPDQAVSRRATE